MSRMGANRRVGVGLAAALVTAGSAVLPASPATAALIQCPASADVFVWDGNANDPAGMVGDNRNWDDAYNWNLNCTPGCSTRPAGTATTTSSRSRPAPTSSSTTASPRTSRPSPTTGR